MYFIMLHLHVTVFTPSLLSHFLYANYAWPHFFFFPFYFKCPIFNQTIKIMQLLDLPLFSLKKKYLAKSHTLFFFKKNAKVVKTKTSSGIHALSVTLYFPYN